MTDASKKHMKGKILFTVIALGGLALCQLGSYLIETHTVRNAPIRVFDFLYVTHVRNMGGIFGIFQGKGWIFALISVLLIVALTIYVYRSYFNTFEYFLFGLIVAGGSSNILDRIVYGSVIDFIDVRGIAFWQYIFNTADVMIHIGVWPLLIYSFFNPEENDVPETQENI